MYPSTIRFLCKSLSVEWCETAPGRFSKVRGKISDFSDGWALVFKFIGILVLSVALFLANAKPVLMPNAELTASYVGFQNSPTQRGTMDIIYSCLSTIFICTVSAIHLDLPRHKSQRLGFWERLGHIGFWKDTWASCFFVLTSLFSPQFMVLRASQEYFSAQEDCRYMVEQGYHGWTLKHSFFAIMGGFGAIYRGNDGNMEICNVKFLSGRKLSEVGANLNEDVCKYIGYDIEDKATADLLTKLVAVFQITSFLIKTTARAAAALPISPLEYFTCAHVFCALMMYVFWLEKPRGAKEQIYVMVEVRLEGESLRGERAQGEDMQTEIAQGEGRWNEGTRGKAKYADIERNAKHGDSSCMYLCFSTPMGGQLR